MKNIPEFYPRRQGRPLQRDIIELESGQTPLLSSYLALKEEYAIMKEILDRLLNEGIQLSTESLIELKKITLHLASMSDEPIDDDSVEEE